MFLNRSSTIKLFNSYCSSSKLLQKSNEIIRVDQHFARQREVKVCGRFSKNSVIFRPWFLRYIPKGGYPFKINYIDTKPDISRDDDSTKTILILHGTPGSYYDFFKFIVDFGSKYRIIVPNFPDFTHTMQTGCFWHSAEEKSEYIADFLKDLNVKNIHCLVVHSMAAYAASYLWIYANHEDYFRLNSICLLNPIGIYSFGWWQQVRMRLLTHMSRSLAIVNLLPSKFINRKSSPKQNIFSRSDIAFWKAITMDLSNFEKYPLRLNVLREFQIPTLFVFSSNDKLYPANVYYDQLYQLQVKSDDFDIYEHYENNLIQSSNGESWIKVVDFRSGGHYVHNTHTYLIHSYIDELLLNCCDHQDATPPTSQSSIAN